MKEQAALFLPVLFVIPLLALFAVPQKADAAAAFVQSKTAWTVLENGNTSTTTTPFNTTAGNLFIVAVDLGGGSDSDIPSVSDNKGNTFIPLALLNNASGEEHNFEQIFYTVNANGGSGHTFTVTAPGIVGIFMTVHEVSGITATNPVDTQSSNDAYTGTSIDLGPVFTHADGEYIFAFKSRTTS